MELEDSTKENPKENENNKSNDPDELSKFMEEEIQTLQDLQPRRSKRGRPATASQDSEILDLTFGYDGPIRSGKSRKKLADELQVTIQDEIDLSNIGVPEPAPVAPKVRGGRGGKKPRAPRKISYKKALAIINAPIPDVTMPKPSSSKTNTTGLLEPASEPARRPSDDAVDLTGDVVMTDKHNKNPLFQKVDVPVVKKTKNYADDRLSLDLDEDIDKITVNVKVNGTIRKYRWKMNQHFYELFKLIAEDEDVPVCHVFFFHGEKRIYPEDTTDSIGHRVSNIYTCRLMETTNVKANKKDLIDIKFQSDKWKKPIALKVSRFETFGMYIKQLCKQLDFKPEQFSLKFDGDDVDMRKSAIELEFEGGEIIDCQIKA